MASLRPQIPRSASYQRVRPEEKILLRPQNEERRSRSHSRNRPSKPYSADGPKRYISNESRARKPPPSPSIEDQGFGPEEVKMRGKKDQTPMIIKVGSELSSQETDDSSASESLSSDTDTGLRSSEDESDTIPKKGKNSVQKDQSRGRRRDFNMDAGSGRNASPAHAPVRIERDRSPYSFKPPPSSHKDARQQPASVLLSPETAPAQASNHTRQRSEPQSGPGRASTPGAPAPASSKTKPVPAGATGQAINASDAASKRPARPIFERRASALPQLSSPTSARSLFVENSSDESDRDKYHRLRTRSGQLTSDAVPTQPASYFDTPRSTGNNKRHSLDLSPPQTPLSPEHIRRTPLNREALINGPALQQLSSVLEGQHEQRGPSPTPVSPRPSPHPSPRHSPTASRHPSPPPTPPERQRHHRRSNTADLLHQDLRNSGKLSSSPLSSRASSPRPGAQTFTARKLDYEGRPPMMTHERRASTWEAPIPNATYPRSPPGSQDNSRASSPTSSRHNRKVSYDSSDGRSHRPRQPAFPSDNGREPSMLEPFRPRHADRRPSSEDLRKALPQISTKPAAINQDLASPQAQRTRRQSGAYVPASASAALGAGLLSANLSGNRSHSTAPDSNSHRRHRSRSRARSDAQAAPRAQSSAPKQTVPMSEQDQPAILPLCARTEPTTNFLDWYQLERNPSMFICPDCRFDIFGRGWERAFSRANPKRNQKISCSMNNPWMRLAALDAFERDQADVKLLAYVAEVSEDEPPCPESNLHDDGDDGRAWFHLRDSETENDYKDFQVCAHCVYSLETVWPRLGNMWHRSRDLKKNEPRVCNLRNDVARMGKYLDLLSRMAKDAKKLPKSVDPPTSDFIWEVKWMTVISPCNGAAVHYGQDMHSHPDIPDFTVCEECYYKTVRPLLKKIPRTSSSANAATPTASSGGGGNNSNKGDRNKQQQQASSPTSVHFAHRISPEAREFVGGSSCKLYSPRMKQIFTTAAREDDFEYLRKAVQKRNDLQHDLEDAKAELAKDAHSGKKKEEVEYLSGKWEKLEKAHERE